MPRKQISIPENCHPFAALVFQLMRDQGVTYDELERRSGVLRSTFKAWRTHNQPGIDTIEAALAALGWMLRPVPVDGGIPAHVALKPSTPPAALPLPLNDTSHLTGALVRIANSSGLSRTDFAIRAGLTPGAVAIWMREATGRVRNFERILHSAGYRLRVRQVGRPSPDLKAKQEIQSSRRDVSKSHWLVQFAVHQIATHGLAFARVEDASGVSLLAGSWGIGKARERASAPLIQDVVAVLRVIGFEVEVARGRAKVAR